MNKEAITVGDVYKSDDGKWIAVVISKDPNFDVNGRMNILFSDGDITPYDVTECHAVCLQCLKQEYKLTIIMRMK